MYMYKFSCSKNSDLSINVTMRCIYWYSFSHIKEKKILKYYYLCNV